MKSVHEGTKDYKCDICDKAFCLKHDLKRHIMTVHVGNLNNDINIYNEGQNKVSLKNHLEIKSENSIIVETEHDYDNNDFSVPQDLKNSICVDIKVENEDDCDKNYFSVPQDLKSESSTHKDIKVESIL